LRDLLIEPLGHLIDIMLLSIITFASGRTNILRGVVHLLPITTYVTPAFNG
jgi:hypothetical protein